MDAVVRKALAKHADERYQTAQEFADAIRARRPGRGHRGGERDDGRARAGQHRRDASSRPPRSPRAARPRVAPRSGRRRRRPSAGRPACPSRVPASAIVAVAVAVAVGAGAWLAWQRFGCRRDAHGAGARDVAPPLPVPRPAPVGAPEDAGACDGRHPGQRHDLGRRPRRSQRPALSGRQGAAAGRRAGRREEPDRREGARAPRRREVAREALRPGQDQAPVEQRRVHRDGRAARASQAWARTASWPSRPKRSST